MNHYPEMESFVIEVHESWTDKGDMWVSAPVKTFNTVESLGTAYPSYSDPRMRDSYAIDLKALLNSCYASRSTERKKKSDYPSSIGDGKDVLFRAVCRITYKVVKDSAATS